MDIALNRIASVQTSQRIWSVDWHPTCNIIASVGESKCLKLWKINQNSLTLYETIPTEHIKSLRCVRFNSAGDKIAVSSFDATITVFIHNGSQGYQQLNTLQGHQSQVKCIDWSQSGKIASCSRDKNVWVWSFNKTSYQYQCQTILQGHTQDVKCVCWIEEGVLASSSYDDTIRIWTQDDGEFQHFQTLTGHQHTVWAICATTKGNFYSCSQNSKLIYWQKDKKTQRYDKLFVYEGIHVGPIYTLSIGGGDNSIAWVQIENQQKKVKARGLHKGDVNCIRYDTNKKLIVSGSDDETISVWSLKLE